MYRKLTAAIAATIMIIALFASLGTAGGAATLDEPATATVKGGTSQKLTITVTNPSDTDNVENVRIWVDGSPGLLENWVAGSSARENLLIAADNLENATPYFNPAGENLILAENNMRESAPGLQSASEHLASPDATDWETAALDNSGSTDAADNVFLNVQHAADELELVASAIDKDVENLDYLESHLLKASTSLSQAAGSSNDNMENFQSQAAGLTGTAATELRYAAENIKDGRLENAGANLISADDNLENAGEYLKSLDSDLSALSDASSELKAAGDNLKSGGSYARAAGTAIGKASDYLASAGGYIDNVENVATGGNFIERAAENLRAAKDNLEGDNIVDAGKNLDNAAQNLSVAVDPLGDALGGKELSDAATYLEHAADNLRLSGQVDLTLASTHLAQVSSYLSDAAAKMASTAGDLKPATWQMGASTDDWIRFDAIKDNYLSPGGSETFTFLTDLTNVGGDYTLKIRYFKQGASDWFAEDTLALTVDNEAPTLEITVSQEGVAENNLVGNTYQDGTATVTIEASEAVSLGDVTVENSTDNLLPPLSLATGDNVTFVGSFEVGEWDTENMNISVASATDAVGNETEDNQSFDVDTKPPIFLDNGLSALIGKMNKRMRADGTTFAYVDNFENENIAGYGNVTVTIGVDGTTYETVYDTPENENRYFVLDGIALNEGLNTVTVTAVDRTGNAYSDNQDNIFIDVEKPEIEFGTITGEDYTKNLTDGVYVNDNTPKISLTITDPGYPDTGLGVSYENIENIEVRKEDGSLAVSENLENISPWDPATGIYENIVPELSDNTYYLHVIANDNLNADVYENVKFIIDTVKPEISPTPTETTIEFGTSANPEVSNEGTLELSGTAESGATVEILVNGEVKATTTAESPWTTTVSLEEGKNKISAKAIDAAGNENSVTYGYILSDFTAPSITIDEPSEGAMLGSKSVTVKGSVSDEVTSVERLTVNGTEVAVATDGSFSTSVTVDEGPRTINLSATDEAGNTSVSTVSVTVDATRPVAEISAPETGLLTKESSVTVQGKAYDEVTSVVEATLNGEAVSLAADGTFSKSVSLSLGSNTISLSAKDEAEHYATDSITVVSDTEDPSVSITAPEDGTTTGDVSVTVKGTVSDEPPETGVTVTVDAAGTSKEVTLKPDGSFTTTVPLSEGETNITVSATDDAGNTGVDTVTVTRTVTPWAMYATFAAIVAIILAAIAVIRRSS